MHVGLPVGSAASGLKGFLGRAVGGETPEPVSTAVLCVIALAAAYTAVYTALAVARGLGKGVKVCEACAGAVHLSPMLAVLCLAVRLGALEVKQEPPRYVAAGMACCTLSVIAQTLVVLVLGLVSDSGGLASKALAAVRWLLMCGLYGGGAAVLLGSTEVGAAASAALLCTLQLCVQYFFVYLGVAVLQTYQEFGPQTPKADKLLFVLKLCRETVAFAPMLCVLFLGAQLRALQVGATPQLWAEQSMYVCAWAVLVQLLLVVGVPYLLGGNVTRGDLDLAGDVAFDVPHPSVFWALNCARLLVMACMYGGCASVVVAVYQLPGHEVSPTLKCVMNLTVQFFLVYLVHWCLVTLRQMSLALLRPFLRAALPVSQAACETVLLCPVLAALFLAVRTRSIELGRSPPEYAQQAMFLATYAVTLQLVMVLLLPLLSGEQLVPDREAPKASSMSALFATVARYAALGLLHLAALAVVVALLSMARGHAGPPLPLKLDAPA